MKRSVGLLLVFLFVLCSSAFAQTVRPQPGQGSVGQTYRSSDPIENISNDLSRISRSVEELNRNWAKFTSTFSSNQGLQLNERQQKLILALDVLNRTEISLANMQKLKLDLIERQSRFRLQFATVTDDILPQSLDRYVALRGTTDAEGLRDIRRQALAKEQRELAVVLNQIQRELDNTNDDIRRTELQVKNLRNQVFGEVERQLADL